MLPCSKNAAKKQFDKMRGLRLRMDIACDAFLRKSSLLEGVFGSNYL